MPRLRLCEADWPNFPRGDEWFEIDTSSGGIDSLSQKLLEELEDAVDLTFIEWLRRLEKGRMSALRQLMWLARRAAGIDEPLDKFWPSILAADIEALPGEAAPGNAAAAPANRAERRATTKSRASGSATSAKSSGSTSARRSTGTRAKSAP